MRAFPLLLLFCFSAFAVAQAQIGIEFTQQPLSQSVPYGSSVTLWVSATGSTPFTYQWRKDGQNISGATSSTYQFTLSPERVGRYSVVVSNSRGSVTSATAEINVLNGAPVITQQPASQTLLLGDAVMLRVTAVGSGTLTYQWLKDGRVLSGVTGSFYQFPLARFDLAGAYTVEVKNDFGTVTSSVARIAVAQTGTVPRITRNPVGATVEVGGTVNLSVEATGSTPLLYRWTRNGAIQGALSSQNTLTISNISLSQAGTYACIVENMWGSVTSEQAVLAVIPQPAARLINLSVLANAGVDERTLIVGFVLGGAGTRDGKAMLFRGVGPSLGSLFGVANVLTDPVIRLFSSGEGDPIRQNDDWAGGNAVFDSVGAFRYPAGAKDSAINETNLSPGAYSIQISGKDARVGRALAELYDATLPADARPTTPRLVNLSARTVLENRGEVNVGFVVGGQNRVRVLIRAAGPSLGAFGVPATLSDPILEVKKSGLKFAENDNWGGTTALTNAFASVGAFAFVDGNTRDAAVVVEIASGEYTASIKGADGGGGAVLLEVYELP